MQRLLLEFSAKFYRLLKSNQSGGQSVSQSVSQSLHIMFDQIIDF